MTASNPDVDLDASLMRARVAQLGSEVEVELLLNFGDVGMADWRTFGEPGSWTGDGG